MKKKIRVSVGLSLPFFSSLAILRFSASPVIEELE